MSFEVNRHLNGACMDSFGSGGPVVRRVLCGQWEFDPPDSEQGLELAIAAPSRHNPDLSALLAACGASARHGPPPVGWVRRVAVAGSGTVRRDRPSCPARMPGRHPPR